VARPRKTVRPVERTLTLPADVYTRLYLHLYSEAERKVPTGAWQGFFVELIQGFFNRKEIYKQVPPWRAKQAYNLLCTIRDLAAHPTTRAEEALPLITQWARDGAALLLKEVQE
jgi:hypothetical protein